MAYVGIFLLSLLVALLAALQLADYFGATEELIAVLMALPAFVSGAMLVFVVVARLARQVAAIDGAAALLAALAFAPLAMPGLVEEAADRASSPFTVGTDSRNILIELIVPALLAVLVLWGLVRRRWLQLRGENGLSRWPWIATALAGFAILNPGGLEVLGQAVAYHPGNMMRDLARMVAFGGIGLLIAAGLIESYIRGRLQRSRPSAQPAGVPG